MHITHFHKEICSHVSSTEPSLLSQTLLQALTFLTNSFSYTKMQGSSSYKKLSDLLTKCWMKTKQIGAGKRQTKQKKCITNLYIYINLKLRHMPHKIWKGQKNRS